jgi:hypothetical protein
MKKGFSCRVDIRSNAKHYLDCILRVACKISVKCDLIGLFPWKSFEDGESAAHPANQGHSIIVDFYLLFLYIYLVRECE